MPDFRKIATTGLISLTLAVASIATVTPALAHGGGGGGFGGGSHGGGMHESGMHEGGFGISHSDREAASVHAFSRSDHFDGRFRGHRPVFFGGDNDYGDCYWRSYIGPFGHPAETEVCD